MEDRNILMARQIAAAVAQAGGRAYYVGGFVRDRLLGIDTKDVDIEIHGVPAPALEALLDRLDGVPDEKRTARFVCAIAAAMPDGCCEVVRGTMEGIIGHKIAGENGFGYDPIFFLPEYGCTSAELSPEKKNELSHRGEGLKKIRKILEQR